MPPGIYQEPRAVESHPSLGSKGRASLKTVPQVFFFPDTYSVRLAAVPRSLLAFTGRALGTRDTCSPSHIGPLPAEMFAVRCRDSALHERNVSTSSFVRNKNPPLRLNVTRFSHHLLECCLFFVLFCYCCCRVLPLIRKNAGSVALFVPLCPLLFSRSRLV